MNKLPVYLYFHVFSFLINFIIKSIQRFLADLTGIAPFLKMGKGGADSSKYFVGGGGQLCDNSHFYVNFFLGGGGNFLIIHMLI